MSFPKEYPFESHFRNVSGVRTHFLDEGEKKNPTLIFMHGVPTWSYTFRKIIPVCVESGYRVVAPDLPGFGLSEKNIQHNLFTLRWLVDWLKEFIDLIGVESPVLFAHDWGAIIGSILASEEKNLFSGMILCNGMLPVPGMKTPLLFRIWRLFARISPVLPVGVIVDFGTKRGLTAGEKRGYGYPFQSIREKKAIRVLPQLLPMGKQHPEINMVLRAWSELDQWNKPLLTIFSDSDPITRGIEHIIHQRIPGTKQLDHVILKGGHFLQEDAPEEISREIIGFMTKQK